MSKTIDLKPQELTKEISTVEINQELQSASVFSEKHKAHFLVGKNRAARFFSIKTSHGVTPNLLAGKFSSLEFSVAAVLDYLKNTKETFAVKSERLHEERQQRKNAEPKPKNS